MGDGENKVRGVPILSKAIQGLEELRKYDEFRYETIKYMTTALEVPFEILDMQFSSESKLWPTPEVEIHGKIIDIKITIPALAAEQLAKHEMEGDDDE